MTMDEINESYAQNFDITRFLEYVAGYRDRDQAYDVVDSGNKISIYYENTSSYKLPISVAYKLKEVTNEGSIIQEAFIIQDTKDIQIQSVCEFMSVLGYTLHVDGKFYADTFWDCHKGGRDRPTFKGCEVLSFNTCAMLHNSRWVSMGYTDCPMKCTSSWRLMIDSYMLNKALATKIVQQVFLQGTKRGQILCHKHLVRFVDSSYQYLFLKDCSSEIHE